MLSSRRQEANFRIWTCAPACALTRGPSCWLPGLRACWFAGLPADPLAGWLRANDATAPNSSAMAVSLGLRLAIAEDLLDQALIGLGRFRVGAVGEDVLLVEAGVLQLHVTGDDRLQDVLGVGLAQQLDRCLWVDGGVARRNT